MSTIEYSRDYQGSQRFPFARRNRFHSSRLGPSRPFPLLSEWHRVLSDFNVFRSSLSFRLRFCLFRHRAMMLLTSGYPLMLGSLMTLEKYVSRPALLFSIS